MTELRDPRKRIVVGIVGTGYFGGGLLRRLAVLNDFEPRIIANRTVNRALAACERAGLASEQIVVTDSVERAQVAIDEGHYVVTTNLLLPAAVPAVDVVVEATGDLLVGTQVAVAGMEAGKHVVAANSDVQATVGPILKVMSDRAGVVYSDIDGDEPGLLKALHERCTDMGLHVLIAGNCKGVLKRYATPETQAAYAAEYGLQPWLATAAADGTKLNFEMTVVANALGMVPAVRGMHGPATDLDHLLDSLGSLDLLNGGRYVDYLLGGRGVFVVVHSTDPQVRSDFRYLKMGDGPFYVFHEPRVLIHYQAPVSIRRAVRHRVAGVAPIGAPAAETIAFAKRDLVPGQHLDGIGGFDTYGLIVRADEAERDRLLPIGIAQYARLARRVAKDEPIGYDAVEIDCDNLALALRRDQDAFFRSGADAATPMP